jgi:hypothetical protein
MKDIGLDQKLLVDGSPMTWGELEAKLDDEDLKDAVYTGLMEARFFRDEHFVVHIIED